MTRTSRRLTFTDLSGDEKTVSELPWQFDYSPLDLPTGPQPEIDQRSQLEAQGMVFRHIRDGVLESAQKSQGIMPTCGDGFYGLYALKNGVDKMHFVLVRSDRENARKWHFRQTQLASKQLGLQERCRFETKEIEAVTGSFGFGILTDVLVHYPNPQAVLAEMRRLVQGPMVVFTTTVQRPKQDFALEVPSYRPWGSCFTHDKVITMAVDAGWTVVNEQRKALPRDWPGERQLSSFLCV